MSADLTRIDRDLAESAKLREETRKFVEEAHKFYAEARKIERQRWWLPFLAAAALVASGAAIGGLFLKAFDL